jgi:hypothetical protein
MIAIGAIGMLYLLAQGFAIGPPAGPTVVRVDLRPAPRRSRRRRARRSLRRRGVRDALRLGLADRGLFDGDGFVAAVFVAVVG